jgi:hypothetical protein
MNEMIVHKTLSAQCIRMLVDQVYTRLKAFFRSAPARLPTGKPSSLEGSLPSE